MRILVVRCSNGNVIWFADFGKNVNERILFCATDNSKFSYDPTSRQATNQAFQSLRQKSITLAGNILGFDDLTAFFAG